ncbi:MAG: HAMP domain-containing protein, partial [Bdellovibrionales bacterium]|nr:HAMP domain-containing protein [Bdellovibrionales bacterium]
VRTSLPLTELEQYLQQTFYRLFGAALVVTMLVVALSFVLYRRITPPLREIRLGAHRYARGQFDRELPDYQIREISELAAAMNKMGKQLKHLEEVRRDFVANVSHELKTPITSIKGFVETLLEGAMEDRDDLARFLHIISRQSERLTAIIEDLLTLARLESEQREDLLLLQEQNVKAALDSAADICRSQAESKGISLELQCDQKLTAIFDRSLLEQAVMNLVDNAIKYSGRKGSVFVRGMTRDGGAIAIEVEDEGPGIPQEHLSRLFERFYRVDKARSRNIGGTGLGLAIVKHVAGVHRGTVTVDSKVGKGTTFAIILPSQLPHQTGAE